MGRTKWRKGKIIESDGKVQKKKPMKLRIGREKVMGGDIGKTKCTQIRNMKKDGEGKTEKKERRHKKYTQKNYGRFRIAKRREKRWERDWIDEGEKNVTIRSMKINKQ